MITKLGTQARKSRVEDYFAYKTDPDFKGEDEAPGRKQDPAGSILSGSQKKDKAVTFAEDKLTLKEVAGAVKAVAGTGKGTAIAVDKLGDEQRMLNEALCGLHGALRGLTENVTGLIGSHCALKNDHEALAAKVDNESSRIDDLQKKFNSVLSGLVTAPTKGDLSGKSRGRATHTIPEEEEFAQTQ